MSGHRAASRLGIPAGMRGCTTRHTGSARDPGCPRSSVFLFRKLSNAEVVLGLWTAWTTEGGAAAVGNGASVHELSTGRSTPPPLWTVAREGVQADSGRAVHTSTRFHTDAPPLARPAVWTALRGQPLGRTVGTSGLTNGPSSPSGKASTGLPKGGAVIHTVLHGVDSGFQRRIAGREVVSGQTTPPRDRLDRRALKRQGADWGGPSTRPPRPQRRGGAGEAACRGLRTVGPRARTSSACSSRRPAG